jgi:hypothetical protein
MSDARCQMPDVRDPMADDAPQMNRDQIREDRGQKE